MLKIDERLSKIERIITDPEFLKNKGLGNEVGYYIFDYEPENELFVREHIAFLKNKLNLPGEPDKIVEFDLYEMTFDILRKKGFVEKTFEFEKKKGFDYTVNAIRDTLRMSSDNKLIVNHIVENTPENAVVFITGVGKCYPFLRSHTVLNNLHQVMDKVPVVMFFPGIYSGQDLRLFGTVKDDNYYRAFKLI